jgi:glycosyltransferase involved in cell wall biosynthesis
MFHHKNRNDKFAIRQKIDLISIIIPVYNEMPNLQFNLETIINFKLNFPSEIIIIESNSNDGSREVVMSLEKNSRVKIFYQEKAMGKGNAIIEGMAHSTGDLISIFDSDGEYLISDLNNLVVPIENGETSFVLGSRYSLERKFFRKFRNQKFLSLFMNIGHQFFQLYFYLLFGLKFSDPFTMHKIFRKSIFKNIDLESQRFEIDWEILGLSIRLGVIPKELPASYESRSFTEGKKISILEDPIRWLYFGLKFRFKRLN